MFLRCCRSSSLARSAWLYVDETPKGIFKLMGTEIIPDKKCSLGIIFLKSLVQILLKKNGIWTKATQLANSALSAELKSSDKSKILQSAENKPLSLKISRPDFFRWGISVNFAETFFDHWNISLICLTAAVKVAVTVSFSLYFQAFWSQWLNFFRSFQNRFTLWPKKNISRRLT